jgi:hypothetical protein
MRQRLVLGFAAWLIAGCAGVPHLPSTEARCETSIPVPVSDAENGTGITDAALLLRYYRYISNLYPQALSREYRDALKAFSENGGATARMQLAMLLSLPNTAIRDDAKAFDLLQACLAGNDDAAVEDLAYLLWTMVNERRHHDTRFRELQQRLTSEQKRIASLQQQLKKQSEQQHTLKRHLQEEKARSAQLQEQLEALKKIERSLRREKPSAPTP